MPKITSFDEANQALLQFVPTVVHQQRYTLERMQGLMKFLGNAQETLKVVHIAGTSGKTSTAYYIAAMLHERGYKVGLTVSPHIDAVNERVQINGVPLVEKVFCQQLGTFLDLVEQFDQKPTYFEVLVAFMYWYFAKAKVDYAVIEVGLGGLLDGTNVVKRPDKMCVITDIGLDHTEVLGPTLEVIAAQKAGIIHPYNSVFTYQQDESIMQVFREVCEQNQAELHEITPTEAGTPSELPLFQRRNWYLAKQVVNHILRLAGNPQLGNQELLTSAHILIPARMELFQINGKTVIIDGSHNEQKIRALLDSIQALYPKQEMAALISFGHNKTSGLKASLRLLIKRISHITATTFSIGQDEIRQPVSPRKIVELCDDFGYSNVDINNDPAEAFKELLRRPEKLLLVTGSFYLLNHIRPLIMNKHD